MQSQTDKSNTEDKFLLFSEEENENDKKQLRRMNPWKVLVVDDDEDVHILTRLVLRGYQFDGENITLLSAFSGNETREIMTENPDISVILLDVIMEDEYTGLELVKYIRDELNNRKVRIILRTGQPGGVLERKVVSTYEIDDYKTKTELTSDKLFTSITTALRAYREIATMDRTRRNLLKILSTLPELFAEQSFTGLSRKIIEAMTTFLNSDHSDEFSPSFSSLFAVSDNNDFRIISATGEFTDKTGLPVQKIISETAHEELNKAIKLKTDIIGDEFLIKFLEMSNHRDCIIYLKSNLMLSKEEKEMASIFLKNAGLILNHQNHQADIISM